MNQAVLLCFTSQDLLDIQQCILDQDSEGALEFLARVVVPQVENAGGPRRPTDRRKADGKLPGQRRDHLSKT